jgi:hypothetical protein
MKISPLIKVLKDINKLIENDSLNKVNDFARKVDREIVDSDGDESPFGTETVHVPFLGKPYVTED